VPATSIKVTNKEVNAYLSGQNNGKHCVPYVRHVSSICFKAISNILVAS